MSQSKFMNPTLAIPLAKGLPDSEIHESQMKEKYDDESNRLETIKTNKHSDQDTNKHLIKKRLTKGITSQ